ncbi:MAG: RNA-binding protein [candidate division KSB1 bacterium]|nr:RNA-binding protein [candidate division KSB1 bacterium]
MNMYIGNLSHKVTEGDLEQLFSDYGTVETVKIVKDRFSGQSKGFGFVDMPDNSEADKAMKALNGMQVKESRIKISQAENKRKRSSRRRR